MAFLRRLFQGPAGPRVCQPHLVFIPGKVAIGASGAVGTAVGKGFTVARTAAGLYSITLDCHGAIPAILYAIADVVFATAGNTQTAKVLTHPATGIITLQCNDAGTVDVAADPPSGSILQFMIVAQNSASTG